MGMIASVYRTGRTDCTNGGISSNHDRLCIVNVEGPFEPDENMPACMLTTGAVGNLVIKPAVMYAGKWQVPKDMWFMMGGNFLHTSDSRFAEACRKLSPDFYGAVAIHDRTE